ncbi:MAG TPA: hypothetical protein VJS40_09995 [Aestuariivirgaceae bacterium]|nr:hypothetical protein [Aestuariivirgaceae bacterium]
MTQHALIVHFRYGYADLTRLFELEDRIEDAIESAGVGRFDGNLVAADGRDGYLYMYGADADRLLDVVEPILAGADFMNGAEVTRQYGPAEPGVREASSTIVFRPPH